MNQKLFILLEFLRHNTYQDGRSPSFSEMVTYMNVGSKQTIDDWLTTLEKEGYIARVGSPQRRIVITKKGQAPTEIIKLGSRVAQEDNKIIPVSTKNYTSTSTYLNSSMAGRGIKLKVNSINSYVMKGGEQDGTK